MKGQGHNLVKTVKLKSAMENTNKTQEPITESNEATVAQPGEGQVQATVPAQDLEKVVDELKDLRKKNAELRSQIESVESTKSVATPEKNDIATTIRQVLAEENKLKSQEQVEVAKTSALQKFKEQNPLYNSSNDPDGSKFKVIEDEFNNFNLSNAQTEEDFANFLGKAAVIAGVSTQEEEADLKTPTHSPTPGSTPGVVNNQAVASLTKEDRAKAQAKGISEERFAELKAKFPNLV